MRIKKHLSLLVVVGGLVATASCGGDDPIGLPTADDAPDEAGVDLDDLAEQAQQDADDAMADAQDASDSDADAPGDPAGVSDDVEVPVARFVAAGPAESTYGPGCATGIENTVSDMFRITVPDDWEYRGSGGGSGSDDIELEIDGATSQVDLFMTQEETESALEYDMEMTGETDVEVVLDGESYPLQAVTVDDRAGYGVFDIAYLSPLPVIGEYRGSVTITSDAELDPAEVAEVLGTVRAERCAIVAEVAIWGPGAGVLLVPIFEDDPLDKTRPDQPQPAFTPGSGQLGALTVEQVAYLLPLESDVATCVAPKAQELAADDFLFDPMILFPSNDDSKDALAALVAEC